LNIDEESLMLNKNEKESVQQKLTKLNQKERNQEGEQNTALG
jgi:hypothetical protein